MDEQTIRIELSRIDRISIGRKSANDLVLSDKSVSGMHCNLFRKDGAWYVTDLNSTNGTFVNDVQVEGNTPVSEGSTLRIMDFSMKLQDDVLTIYGPLDLVTSHVEPAEEPTGEQTEQTAETPEGSEEGSNPSDGEKKRRKIPPDAPYPYFYPSPRLMERIPTGEIVIDPVPNTMEKPSMSWVSIVFSSLGMMAMMAVIGLVAGGILFNPLYMLPMVMMSVITGVINYSSQKKRFKKEQELLQTNYSKYLEDKEHEIKAAISVQQAIQKRENPDNETLLEVVRNRGVTMWNRTVHDEDAVSVRVGTTSTTFAMNIKVQKVGFTLVDKQFQRDPQEIAARNTTVEDVPLVHNFRDYPTLGIVGDYENASSLARSMILQAATHYGYDDLKIVVVYPEELSSDFDMFRFLPHVRDYGGEYRYIACTSNESREFNKLIAEELKDRAPKEGEGFGGYGIQTVPSPFYLFVVLAPGLLDNNILGKMFSNQSRYGCGTIILSRTVHELPPETVTVIEARGEESRYYERNRANMITNFKQDSASVELSEEMARLLAPVRTEGGSAEQSLPTYVTFLQGYGIRKPDELDLADYWENSRPEQTMAVPIGIRSNGTKFSFDINEKAHGPHGLVAGTTGSGKSEMIQSWILSMALQFSPREVSFVLIDFKGTGLILPFLNLPHLAGTISDLDVTIDRNLVALEAELQRRKSLFDEAGVSNISGYLELYHKGIVEEPLSYLFVIIDEYAEFKSLFPDFTAGVNSLFRTGRTLGVHIILLTQNPSGIISDQSESNVSFRWCLKVASPSASKEILGGHPDAAKLTNPGRAYVRVGTDEIFEPIQSFYSGAKYTTDLRRRAVPETPKAEVSAVGRNGVRRELVKDNSLHGRKLTRGTEIEAIVNYIHDYTVKKGIPMARPIWNRKLPDIIYLFDLLKEYEPKKDGVIAPVVGMLDDPSTQSQFPFYLPMSESGHAVIFGAPGVGKSTFLQTLILSLCYSYSPEEVNLYLLDFGSWTMGMFKDYPHVGSVANDNEEEKVLKTVQLLESTLDERKMTFSKMGIGSIQAYNYSAEKKLPYIFLIIDNFTSVLQLYPTLEDFFQRLTKEGGNYGVLLAATVGSAGGLGFRLQQNIKNNVALQMTDNGDYASIVGRTGGLYPEAFMGRGLYKTDRVLEFQTALPGDTKDDNERSLKIRQEGERMKAQYRGRLPRMLPIMPDVIGYGTVNAGTDLTFGLSVGELTPVGMNLSDSHTLLISGKAQSGRTNLLRTVIRQLTDRGNVQIAVSGNENEYADLGVRMLTDEGDVSEYLTSLSEEMKARKQKADNGETLNDPLLCLVIEEIDQRITEWNEGIVNRLNALAQMGKGLNVALIMSGDARGLSEVKAGYAVLNKMAGAYGIILGGSPQDHKALRNHLPQDQLSKPLKEYEGCYTDEHKTLLLKIMSGK